MKSIRDAGRAAGAVWRTLEIMPCAANPWFESRARATILELDTRDAVRRELPGADEFAESFQGRMRDECLNERLFFSMNHARAVVAGWVDDFNTARPHSAIGYLTPAAYAAT